MYIIKVRVYRLNGFGYGDWSEINLYTNRKIEDIPAFIEKGAREYYPENYTKFVTKILSIETLDGVII